jgi:hypothetical protein
MREKRFLWLLRLVVLIGTVEKVIQHGLTALFFLVDIPGIGTPDIGTRFDLSNPTMVVLNVVYALLFVWALILVAKKAVAGYRIILFLASLDIALEFIFHWPFFITVSVLVSTLISLCCIPFVRVRADKQRPLLQWRITKR